MTSTQDLKRQIFIQTTLTEVTNQRRNQRSDPSTITIGIISNPATPETFIRFPNCIRFGKRIESQLPIIELMRRKDHKTQKYKQQIAGVRS